MAVRQGNEPILAPRPGPVCGWDGTAGSCKGGLPATAHVVEPGHDYHCDSWHWPPCQIPNPNPGPWLDGYGVCDKAAGHRDGCCYIRHVAEGLIPPFEDWKCRNLPTP